MTLLRVEGLVIGYGEIEVLHGLELAVEAGEAVAVIGANGAGKTTLLHAMTGLVPTRRGTVTLAGEDVTGASPRGRVRAGMALVPEARQVFAELSVRDNLRLGAYGRRRQANVKRDLDETLELFPALSDKLGQSAGLLSGGQQQMLAIGRALMARPKLLLLDEPTLGLAPRVAMDVAQRLRQLRQEGTTLLIIEQNVAMALSIAHRGYLLERGEFVVAGSAEQLAADARVAEAYLGGGIGADRARRRPALSTGADPVPSTASSP